MHYTSRKVYEYISTQTKDPNVERKTCRLSWTQFPIYQSDLDFYKKISPTFNWVTYNIPTPTLCPEERQRRRLMFRNERNLYKRKCDATGEPIISIYSPNKLFNVFEQRYWYSDNRNSLTNKTQNNVFKKNILDLIWNIPFINSYIVNSQNSDYACYVVDSINIYLSQRIWNSSNIYYTYSAIENSDNCFDCMYLRSSSNCYECLDSKNLSNCTYCEESDNLDNCHHCFKCHNCIYCYWCSWLQNKQYYINNKSYTKEEYFKKVTKTTKEKIEFHRSLTQISSESCYWNKIIDSNQIVFWFDCFNTQNSKYCTWPETAVCIYDSDYNFHADHAYEQMSIIHSNKCYFSSWCIQSNNICYSLNSFNCSYLFWCVNIKNASYCIFNKQYTKQEYETLVPKIITHMQETWERGEFFDPSLSPFGYNETVAQEYFPLTREEALARWYTRQDTSYDPIIPPHVTTLSGDQIPKDITTVTDDILKSIFICEISWRPFRIIKQELDFYRKHSLPLPRKHPDVRHQERLKKRPWRTLFLRSCDKCNEEMLSVYPHESTDTVLCELCYKKEIFA